MGKWSFVQIVRKMVLKQQKKEEVALISNVRVFVQLHKNNQVDVPRRYLVMKVVVIKYN